MVPVRHNLNVIMLCRHLCCTTARSGAEKRDRTHPIRPSRIDRVAKASPEQTRFILDAHG